MNSIDREMSGDIKAGMKCIGINFIFIWNFASFLCNQTKAIMSGI